MFISVLGPCRGCILRPAGPPECGAFAARLNAAHFKLLQQQDTPCQAENGIYLKIGRGTPGQQHPSVFERLAIIEGHPYEIML